jgi:hypothetical protein
MFTVVLEREPHKPNAVWTHDSQRRAERQAYTLADLHHCTLTHDKNVITVHAADHYKPQVRD